MLVYTGLNASSGVFFENKKEIVITDGFLELKKDITGLEIEWNYFLMWRGEDLFISGNFGAGNEERKLMVPGDGESEIIHALPDKEAVTIETKDRKIWRFEVYNNIWKSISNFIPSNDENLQEFVVKMDRHSSIFALTNLGRIFNIPNLIDMPKRVKFVDIACGFDHIVILAENGDVYSLGMGTRGQLGHGDLDDCDEPMLVEALAGLKIRKIAAGGWHSAALTEDGDLYTWGWNTHGELGITSEQKVVPIPTVVDFKNEDGCIVEENIKNVQCGNSFTLCLSAEGKLWGSGSNKYSQLGPKAHFPEFVHNFVEIKIGFSKKITEIKCNGWGSLLTLAP